MGGEVAVVPGLAGDEPEGERLRGLARGGQGAESADGAELATHPEAVEVLGARLEPLDARVHGVGEAGLGERPAMGDDAAEVLVGRDLPAHRHLLQRHPAVAVLGQRLGGQTGPQHGPVGSRGAGGDAEGEHPLGPRRRRGLDGGGVDAEREHGGGGAAELEQAATADGGGGGRAGHGDSRSGAGVLLHRLRRTWTRDESRRTSVERSRNASPDSRHSVLRAPEDSADPVVGVEEADSQDLATSSRGGQLDAARPARRWCTIRCGSPRENCPQRGIVRRALTTRPNPLRPLAHPLAPPAAPPRAGMPRATVPLMSRPSVAPGHGRSPARQERSRDDR